MKQRKRIRTAISLLIITVLLTTLAGCSTSYLYEDENGAEYYAGTSTQFDTYVSISLFAGGSNELMSNAFEMCEDFDIQFSRTLSGGELYTINRTSRRSDEPLSNQELSDGLAEVIKKALYYCELTDGSYDITVCPVSKLWDFSAENPTVPAAEDIAAALPLVDWRGVTLSGNTLSFDRADMEIDLGSIAKGYIADKLKEYLVANGVTSGIISVGGNILCIGARPDKVPFNVGVQKPFAESAETVAVMQISDMSVVSTGIYERCFTQMGTMYHHIINPRDGFPFNNDLVGVTIIGESSVDCDALSTACFTLGYEKGLELIDSIPGYHAVFITSDYEIHYSTGFHDSITVTDYVPAEDESNQ